ncbi:hypothetical protein L596_004786 [Steinernema carpocapsae]|uniref:Uncharacterized protein n=1 Tax=Steinernema carpocapsae TaxID=34508 RepID=A0A4U8UWY7_STECR|nr:hypothetical protein L596_004786 [Steinernema carpocapsae]
MKGHCFLQMQHVGEFGLFWSNKENSSNHATRDTKQICFFLFPTHKLHSVHWSRFRTCQNAVLTAISAV